MSGMANGIGQETDQWGVGRMSRDLVRALPVQNSSHVVGNFRRKTLWYHFAV
uniref:Uncharacterized protein n=1 Tax=Anguilla anguilla TaxID=7936 RepID=A0A0E9RZF7_ANGAN